MRSCSKAQYSGLDNGLGLGWCGLDHNTTRHTPFLEVSSCDATSPVGLGRPLFPAPSCFLVGLFLSVGDVSFSHLFAVCYTRTSLFKRWRAETCVHHLRLLLDCEDSSFDVCLTSCGLLFKDYSFACLLFTLRRSSPGRTQRMSKRSVRIRTLSLIIGLSNDLVLSFAFHLCCNIFSRLVIVLNN